MLDIIVHFLYNTFKWKKYMIFYLYQRLLSYSSDFDKFVQIKMQKPKNKFRKVLHFKIFSMIYIGYVKYLYYLY